MIYIIQKRHPLYIFPRNQQRKGDTENPGSLGGERWTIVSGREYGVKNVTNVTEVVEFYHAAWRATGLTFSEISTTAVLYWRTVAGFIRFRAARVENVNSTRAVLHLPGMDRVRAGSAWKIISLREREREKKKEKIRSHWIVDLSTSTWRYLSLIKVPPRVFKSLAFGRDVCDSTRNYCDRWKY